tara:strand:+ start:75 stop:236 length:162 start_codon:yes stop_codon:yes gene_type:complete
MVTYTIEYTWIGNIEIEATDEDDAMRKVHDEIEKCGGDPRALFDLDDETFEVT